MNFATDFVRRELASAVVQMPGDKPRPHLIKWVLDDAARGRPFKPLGRYPELAEACLDNGSPFYSVAKPLQIMLAHLRRRCGKASRMSLADALRAAKKEGDEAEACALNLAFSGSRPEASDFAAYDKEATEAILALEQSKELVEDIMARESK